MSEPETIKCGECSTPVFKVVGPNIVLLARHHGSPHTTVIPISSLVAGPIGDSALYEALKR